MVTRCRNSEEETFVATRRLFGIVACEYCSVGKKAYTGNLIIFYRRFEICGGDKKLKFALFNLIFVSDLIMKNRVQYLLCI